MARRTGPKHKLCRAAGEALCGSPKCPALKRPYPPGQHGPNKRSRKSEYGTQLMEKQKLRYIYGLLDKQFRRYYDEAARREGVTGDNLLTLLECRLDNLAYRFGFARTIDGARQVVTHGHLRVNGKRVDIPSYGVKPGDVITLSEKASSMKHIAESLEARPAIVPYLSFDDATTSGKLERVPLRDEIPVHINEALIVEYFSR